MNLNNFKELGLSETTLKELEKKGFSEPTEIQHLTIPVLLNEEVDIIAQAQTGTGKTAAFALPLIEKITHIPGRVQAIILVPTRELAHQVSDEINSFSGNKKLKIVPIYGGQSMPDQLSLLKKGVDIVVGTPGRVYDHVKRKSLKLQEVSYVVLDEADEMLNMGFLEEIEDILKHTNKDRRTLLFSATMPDRIMKIAKNYMKEYQVVKALNKQLTVDLTEQLYYEIDPSDKLESLCRVFDITRDFYGLVFCRTKASVDELVGKLVDKGYNAEAIHGDMSQNHRGRVLEKFKRKKLSILVATDVAARGIDVTDLTHVINYSLPQDTEAYIHRIGRTGRAGKKGTAISIISPGERRKLNQIVSMTKKEIKKEKLPAASEVVKIKKTRIKADLNEIIASQSHKDYFNSAMQMLEDNEPVDIIAAILKYSLDDELNEKKYKAIKDVTVKTRGKTSSGKERLFVAIGTKDGLTPRKLMNLIKKESNVGSDHISQVEVMENFSFLTVPSDKTDKIIDSFNSNSEGRRPVIQRANVSKSSSGKPENSRRRKRRA